MPRKSSSSVRLADLAPSEAVGALTPDEQRTFDRLLKSASAADKKAIAAQRDLVAILARAMPPVRPPATLKKKILAKTKVSRARESPPAALLRLGHGRRGFYSVPQSEEGWAETGVPGVTKKELTINREQNYVVLLVRMLPRSIFPAHHHGQAEECYVIDGDVRVQGRTLRAGDFHHADKTTDHSAVSTRGGCTVLLVVSAADYA